MKKLFPLILAALVLLCGCAPGWSQAGATAEKPAIYLYPEEGSAPAEKPILYLLPGETTEITVKLDLDGELKCTYPAYQDGWTVSAAPDGTLTDENGRQYPYLFWEGTANAQWDMSRGFVVPGGETAAFLEEKLALLGLNDREAADFITYWLPRMQDNAYNLVAFQGETYTKAAKLTVTPEPDTMLRVFMAFRPLDEPVDIPQQELVPTERTGFTVVEWGGCEMK